MRARLALAMVMTSLGACEGARVDYGGLPNPQLSEDVGLVIVFTGMAGRGEDLTGTGMDGVTQQLRAFGVSAQVWSPVEWREAANTVVAHPGARRMPVAIVGYSAGAAAATQVAHALNEASIPVQTLIVIEARNPRPVSCNVRRAVDLFNSRSVFSLSQRLRPGPGFSGELKEINYSTLTVNSAKLDHWSISQESTLHRLTREEVLIENKVRSRPQPSGEATCMAG